MFFKTNKKFNLSLFSAIFFLALGYGLFLIFNKDDYEAIGIVELAHVNAPHQRSTLNVIDLQNPRITIAAIRYPGKYNTQIRESCGLSENQKGIDEIQNKLTVSVLVGTDSAVVMKYRGKSADLAINCLSAITNKLLEDQKKVSENYLKESLNFLRELSLKRKQELSNLRMATSDDMKKVHINSIGLLDDEMQKQTQLVQSINYRQAKLMSPISIQKTNTAINAAFYSAALLVAFLFICRKNIKN